MTIAEMADRFTILKMKKGAGFPVDEELEMIKSELPAIPEHLLSRLEKINRQIWKLHEQLGRMQSKLHQCNQQRILEKNNIAVYFNELIEYKTNYVADYNNDQS